MSSHAYSEIYLHITWHTKDNIPFIDESIEKPLYDFLRVRCSESPGVFCHAIGGARDHVHLCISAPPDLLISEWIGKVKGASSHYVNSEVKPKSLQWQNGYGVVSFGKNNLKFVKNYVENQKEHHRVGKVYFRLERSRP